MSHGPLMWRWTWVLAVSGVLSACASAPRRYALDTASNTCRQSPVQCAGLYGSEAARAKAQMEAAAAAGATLASAQRLLDEVTRVRIVKVLEECANMARLEVLLRRMKGRSPTPEKCREVVETNTRGEAVTLAMKLGEEMHQFARACAEESLDALIPGRFSLEQRFRYDSQTGQTALVTREEETFLLKQGLSRELLGTLKPDVVIHLGNPLLAQAVYDFKFPCVSDGGDTSWRTYPRGHPHAYLTQKKLYQKALNLLEEYVQRILPYLGALP